jgi:hypothetical protein
MKKQEKRDLIKIVILLFVFTVIIPWTVMFFFLGKDAFRFIGYVALMAIACFIFLPVYVLGSLARSGAPVPIGKFFSDALDSIKMGIAQNFKKKK